MTIGVTASRWIGLLLPFFGTALGAGMAVFLCRALSARRRNALLGFAAGVMLAASVWSLLLPALAVAEGGRIPPWLAAVGGFLLGVAALLLGERWLTRHEIAWQAQTDRRSSRMLFLAVTLHNVPEGMAVGAVLAGLTGGVGVNATAAAVLALGIAIQNIPEGAIISAPLITEGRSRWCAWAQGVLSGAVEPLGAVLMMALTAALAPLLPIVLSFAAGAMFYVVVEELIPDANAVSGGKEGTVGAALGFAVMMLLDVTLG